MIVGDSNFSRFTASEMQRVQKSTDLSTQALLTNVDALQKLKDTLGSIKQ
jgi:hypothetical protein